MHKLLRIVVGGIASAALLGGAGPASASDQPLGLLATYGPGHVGVVVAGTGLGAQPATFDVVLPDDATIVATWLYVTGRGEGDDEILVNGTPVTMPLVGSAGPLPFDASQSTETRRLELTGSLEALVGPGTSSITVDGYGQLRPGGAFVIAVFTSASVPEQTVTVLDGSDYAFQDFAPPFGPNTEVSEFAFAPTSFERQATLHVITHDTEADRPDATWVLLGNTANKPVPASLVGGTSGAFPLQVDRLGVLQTASGLSVGAQLDILSTGVVVPKQADYVAFQTESRVGGALPGDSLVMAAAVLVLPTTDGTNPPPPPPPPGVCGDTMLDPGEQCDDGNVVSGDGCTADCRLEAALDTWDVVVRARRTRREGLWFFTMLPHLPSSEVGTAPLEVTLLAGDKVIFDVQIPAGGFSKVRPEATPAFPDGRRAVTRGLINGFRVRKLKVFPMENAPMYNLALKARGEMLEDVLGVTRITSIVRVGDRVFSSQDDMVLNLRGTVLRNVIRKPIPR